MIVSLCLLGLCSSFARYCSSFCRSFPRNIGRVTGQRKRLRSSQSSSTHLPFMYPSTKTNIPSCNFFKFLTCKVTLYPSHSISRCANGHRRLFSRSIHSSLDNVWLFFILFSLAARQAGSATFRRPPARGGFARVTAPPDRGSPARTCRRRRGGRRCASTPCCRPLAGCPTRPAWRAASDRR